MGNVEIVQFPGKRYETSQQTDLRTFSEALYEAADLLEVGLASDDEELRKASVELAVRALNAAGAFISKNGERRRGAPRDGLRPVRRAPEGGTPPSKQAANMTW